MGQVELRIDARPALVRTARQVAVTLARRVGLDDELLDEVRLAVSEAAGLAVAVAVHERSGPVSLRYDDGDGFVVDVGAPGSLAVARGEAASDVLDALLDHAGDGQGAPGDRPPDDVEPLPAGSTLMVLRTIVPDVDVRTGPEGLAVRLAWPA